jgi:hypothetical protein
MIYCEWEAKCFPNRPHKKIDQLELFILMKKARGDCNKSIWSNSLKKEKEEDTKTMNTIKVEWVKEENKYVILTDLKNNTLFLYKGVVHRIVFNPVTNKRVYLNEETGTIVEIDNHRLVIELEATVTLKIK